MNATRTTIAVALAAALIAPVSQAAQSEPARSAQACAEILHGQTEARMFEVVKMTTGGSRTFTFWLNAQDASQRGYCVVQAGEIVQVNALDGHWQATRMFRPNEPGVVTVSG